ncbi:hypothetical protein AMTRI_Chr07g23740 [Amborella trichopoda]
MESKWRKAKSALGLRLCTYMPKTLDDSSSPADSTGRLSDYQATSTGEIDYRPLTPTPTSAGLRLSRNSYRSSKRTCSICLGAMKPGNGHALFTAECSHSFHFHCILSNVKHGSHACPVCRAKWKEVPFPAPSSDHNSRARISPLDWPNEDPAFMTILRRLPQPRPPHESHHHHLTPLFHAPEPASFTDDEPLDPRTEPSGLNPPLENPTQALKIETHPEFDLVPRSLSLDNFSILVHLKAPYSSQNGMKTQLLSPQSHRDRAPVDLVTVLDVSGSMAGTKLALLKRAMGFVIQNLGPSDRLSVIAFSSNARRLFNLRRMSESGRQQALHAVNALASTGGTNIAEGLRKAAKVISDRRERNPVCSIILLSDGQDTYTVGSAAGAGRLAPMDYTSLLPSSVQAPVHAFGFGADHDAGSMHAISEASGGTFSFIEAEGAIQDAFAQCIGGLLSVVVQDVKLSFDCVVPGVRVTAIRAGSYTSSIMDGGQGGSVNVGDLYAEEERNFLVDVTVPAMSNRGSSVNYNGGAQPESGVSIISTFLLSVRCMYKDPITGDGCNVTPVVVEVTRPIGAADLLGLPRLEVDRERQRAGAAETMAEARALAEHGDLRGAVAALDRRRSVMAGSAAWRAGDELCLALDAELAELQWRMASRAAYESSGRAYVLSGLSSHSWQRATARGASAAHGAGPHGYQTPCMADMLARSRTMGPPATAAPVRPRPRPR